MHDMRYCVACPIFSSHKAIHWINCTFYIHLMSNFSYFVTSYLLGDCCLFSHLRSRSAPFVCHLIRGICGDGPKWPQSNRTHFSCMFVYHFSIIHLEWPLRRAPSNWKKNDLWPLCMRVFALLLHWKLSIAWPRAHILSPCVHRKSVLLSIFIDLTTFKRFAHFLLLPIQLFEWQKRHTEQTCLHRLILGILFATQIFLNRTVDYFFVSTLSSLFVRSDSLDMRLCFSVVLFICSIKPIFLLLLLILCTTETDIDQVSGMLERESEGKRAAKVNSTFVRNQSRFYANNVILWQYWLLKSVAKIAVKQKPQSLWALHWRKFNSKLAVKTNFQSLEQDNE